MRFSISHLRVLMALGGGIVPASSHDLALGAWRLNARLSRLVGWPVPKAMTVNEHEAGWIVMTTVYAQPPGHPDRRETLRLKRDGQDYPVKSGGLFDTVSSFRIDPRLVETVYRKEGREVIRCAARYTADGNTCEVRCARLDEPEKKTVTIWEREGK